MKLMIASDIHGSVYYCRKLMEAFTRENPDKLVLLGDLLYHGPRNDLPREYAPKQVIELLNNIKKEILCVRGNCDTEVDQMVLEFPIMAEYAVFYVENHMIFITHGHKHNEKNPPFLKKGDILLTGHTHVPAYEKCGDFMYVNPGSISIPKEESEHGYMILEEKSFLWKNLDGVSYRKENPWNL